MRKKAYSVASSAGLGILALASHSLAQLAIPAESVVVDPWETPSSNVVTAWTPVDAGDVVAAWTPVEPREVIQPWTAAQPESRPSAPEIVDPWQGEPIEIPTRAFPSVDLVDPWPSAR